MTDYARTITPVAIPAPGSGFRAGQQELTNNVLRERAMADTERRTGVMESTNALREQQLAMQQQQMEQEQALIPYKYQQLKGTVIAKVAGQLRGIPDSATRVKRYGDFLAIADHPIAVDPRFGELGKNDTSLLLSKEEFARMTDKEQDNYLNFISSSSGEMSKADLLDKNFDLKVKEMNLQYELFKKKAELEFDNEKILQELKKTPDDKIPSEVKAAYDTLKMLEKNMDPMKAFVAVQLGQQNPDFARSIASQMALSPEQEAQKKRAEAIISRFLGVTPELKEMPAHKVGEPAPVQPGTGVGTSGKTWRDYDVERHKR